jgi:hypothetical protein
MRDQGETIYTPRVLIFDQKGTFNLSRAQALLLT